MNNIWKQYTDDFNQMTDEEIDNETRRSQDLVNEHTEWLEAVASWVSAGKPRDKENTQ